MSTDHTVASDVNISSLCSPLQEIFRKLKDVETGCYSGDTLKDWGVRANNIPAESFIFSVRDPRFSVINTGDYADAKNKDMQIICIQGYADVKLFQKYSISSVLVGAEKTASLNSNNELLELVTTPHEERAILEQKRLTEAATTPAFYETITGDPLKAAESTNGLYIITDHEKKTVTVETVMNTTGAFSVSGSGTRIAFAFDGNVNTFKNTSEYGLAFSVTLFDSEFHGAGSIGQANGKIDSFGIAIERGIKIAPYVELSNFSLKVAGLQSSRFGFSASAGIGVGEAFMLPGGMSTINKVLSIRNQWVYPLSGNVSGTFDPSSAYYNFSANASFLGIFNVAGEFSHFCHTTSLSLRAGLIKNRCLNVSLNVDFYKNDRQWYVKGAFDGSLKLDQGELSGTHIAGGIKIEVTHNRCVKYKDAYYSSLDFYAELTGKLKFRILSLKRINITVKANLRRTPATEKDMIYAVPFVPAVPHATGASGGWGLRSARNIGTEGDADTGTSTDTDAGEMPDVLICEGENIAENKTLPITVGSDVLDVKSWNISADDTGVGIMTFQVAAKYTLADSNWRLTHSCDGVDTVYTAENSADLITVNTHRHNYYDLVVDSPDAGDWTLEIIGDSKTTGDVETDAWLDEKIMSGLKLLEQTDTTLKFKAYAYTNSETDHLSVELYAEKIATEPGDPNTDILVATLSETGTVEFEIEIPEELRDNANCRFYLRVFSTENPVQHESNSVEVYLPRTEASLECDWELVYSGDNTDTVTALITVTNTGAEDTVCKWEILDYTNGSESIEEMLSGELVSMADVIAAGECVEVKGNSSVTFEQVITITDELRDNPSALKLTVSKCDADTKSGDDDSNTDDEIALKDITFSALDSMYCVQKTVSWQAVDGAASYVLEYALEGDWENNSIYVKDITDTSYTLSVAPGEYTYRVVALDNSGNAIGTWNEEKDVDVAFSDHHSITIGADIRSDRSTDFSLNDGIYNFNGSCMDNFTGTLTLYRKDTVQVGKDDDSVTMKEKTKKILTLKFVNGELSRPVSEKLLDHGVYFWEWKRSGKRSVPSEVSLELSGEVFPSEDEDRNYTSIGGSDSDVEYYADGTSREVIEGAVGFFNKNAVWKYNTDDGGELTLTIRSGTVFDAGVRVVIYEQSATTEKFRRVKSLTVKAGEYTADKVILDALSLKNNFHIEVISRDNGRGKYNTDYSFDLQYDAFGDDEQTTDVLEIDGDAVSEWIGMRNQEHSYLLQVDSPDRYAIRLEGDAGDATLKLCNMKGRVIKRTMIKSNGVAEFKDLYLESGNYIVEVESRDKGNGKYNTDYTLSASRLQTLYPEIDNTDDTWKLAAELESFELDEPIENWLGVGDDADFFKISLDPERSEPAYLALKLDEKTAQAVDDGILKLSCRNESGRSLAIRELDSGEWGVRKELSGSDVYIGVSLRKPVEEIEYAFEASVLTSL